MRLKVETIVLIWVAVLAVLVASFLLWPRIPQDMRTSVTSPNAAAWWQMVVTLLGIAAAAGGLAWQVHRQHEQSVRRDSWKEVNAEAVAIRDVRGLIALAHAQIDMFATHTSSDIRERRTVLHPRTRQYLNHLEAALRSLPLRDVPQAHLKVELLGAIAEYQEALGVIDSWENQHRHGNDDKLGLATLKQQELKRAAMRMERHLDSFHGAIQRLTSTVD